MRSGGKTRPFTLFDSGGGIQFSLFDALHGCVQCSGQELCSLHIQYQLLSMTETKNMYVSFSYCGVAVNLSCQAHTGLNDIPSFK